MRPCASMVARWNGSVPLFSPLAPFAPSASVAEAAMTTSSAWASDLVWCVCFLRLIEHSFNARGLLRCVKDSHDALCRQAQIHKRATMLGRAGCLSPACTHAPEKETAHGQPHRH